MIFPIANFSWKESVSQLFGVGKDVYFPKFGIPGHNAIDVVVRYDAKRGYGTEILAAHNGKVWVIEQDVPYAPKASSKGNGLYIISEDGTFATVYWHLSQFLVGPDEVVKEGQPIALMGNSGYVFPIPTPQCPTCGTHLHFGCFKIGYNNDYNGFTDPVPFLAKEGDKLPIYFAGDLFFGSQGDEVSWLQTVLRLEGFAQDYDPIGYYGTKTLRDVKNLQTKYSFGLSTGYFGPKTRDLVMKKWSVYS